MNRRLYKGLIIVETAIYRVFEPQRCTFEPQRCTFEPQRCAFEL
ncbi:MAG: hypothetical protein V7L11_15625 [Nostoc sp.]